MNNLNKQPTPYYNARLENAAASVAAVTASHVRGVIDILPWVPNAFANQAVPHNTNTSPVEVISLQGKIWVRLRVLAQRGTDRQALRSKITETVTLALWNLLDTPIASVEIEFVYTNAPAPYSYKKDSWAKPYPWR